MAEQPKKSQITFTADLPLQIADLNIEPTEPMPDQARNMVQQVAPTVKAYLDGIKELLEGPYKQLRDIAPTYLSDRGNVLGACCENGVVIRYEPKAETRKIIGGWFPGYVSKTAALISQNLVHCHAENLPAELPPTGHRLEFFKQDMAGNKTEFLSLDVSFHVVLQSPKEETKLPAPPNKPYCLLSIHNEIEVQFFGEFIQQGKPTDSQPFVVRSLIRLPVGWECIEVYPFYNPDHWKTEYARGWAERDLLAAVVRRQMREAELRRLDPTAAARK